MKLTKTRAIGVAAVSIAGALAFALPGIAGHPETNKAYTDSQACGDNNDVHFNGTTALWPPNHKFVDESITAHDGDGGNSSLTVYDAVTGDAIGGDGGATHDPDYVPTSGTDNGDGSVTAMGDPDATVGFQLRAERSGKGGGRTYTLDWSATFDGTETCKSTDEGYHPFVVTVPHDMGKGNDV